ncbi:MAG: hypothetical protein OXL96_28335 [Candidatus Poribacteria bacterium]|nr:hypothetical protein [Candidatus Poribacteria bacterium]
MIGATDNTFAQHRGLIPAVSRCYRDNFGLLWRIMLPSIIFSFLLDTVILYSFYLNIANTSWFVSTSDGFSITRSFQTGTGLYISFTFSSFIAIFLWHTMCPLALAVFQTYRGVNVTDRDVWRHTLGRIRSILGASLILMVWVLSGLVFLLSVRLAIVIVALMICITVYFAVRWSLYNQCIIIEGLSAVAAFRRSGELVMRRWWSFLGRYLILLWVSGVLISVLFAITLLLLSITEPEFVLIREALVSGQFFDLFWGIDVQFTFYGEKIVFGNVAAPLASIPSFWTISVILVIKTLLYAALAPVWAILTTYLYLKRTSELELRTK